MKIRKLQTVLALVLVVSSSACFVSITNPLPATQKLARDERLLGKWTVTDDQGTAHAVIFEPHSDREMTASIPGHFLGAENRRFRVATTRISDHDHMILSLDELKSADGYIVARYTLEGTDLKICILDSDPVREAIKTRKLKGSYGSLGAAEITESSQGVLSFLKSKETDAMFTCPKDLNFTKAAN